MFTAGSGSPCHDAWLYRSRPMLNKLYVGFSKEIEVPKGGCLILDDEAWEIPKARVFDVGKHCFNPLKEIDYRGACDVVALFDAVFDRGDTTLTKDTGLDFISDELEGGPGSLADLISPPDKKATTGHIWAYSKVRRMLRSPVLKRVLCNPTNFSFNPRSVIVARVSRKELGEFDALVLGLFLMAHFKGQLVVPDFGFYGRDAHVSLLREGRLIAGVNVLGELPPKLRQNGLLVKDKIASGATHEDAETLAAYAGHARATNAFNEFVQGAMA